MPDYSKLYRIYVDEAHDDRYFGLTGFVVRAFDYMNSIHPSFQALKIKYFPRDLDAEDPKPVIFHRHEIVRKRNQFGAFRNEQKYESFVNDIILFLSNNRYFYKTISIAIDKQDLKKLNTKDNYLYTLQPMLYIFHKWLAALGGNGDVMFESRGNKDDELVGSAYNVWTNGGYADFPLEHYCIGGLHSRKKESNVCGLQCADLLAWPLNLANLEKNNVTMGRLGGFNRSVWEAISCNQEEQWEIKEFQRVKVYIYETQR